MLLAVEMGPAVARSSLELMLDSIRLRDERPEGVPPALPARPTSRGRLPSSRKPLPVRLKSGSNTPELRSEDPEKWGEKVVEFKSGIFGSKKMLKVERPKGSLYAKMPELESYEEGVGEADGPDSSASLSRSPDAKLGWEDTTDCVLKKIAAEEDARHQTLQWILCIQKSFRGFQARRSFQKLKRGVTTLQSFVRGERARCEFDYMVKKWKAVVLIQKYVKRRNAMKAFAAKQKDTILLQSVIRGWLARRRFIVLKNLEMTKHKHVKVNRDPGKNLREMKDTNKDNVQVCPSALVELQTRVLQAEASLRHKEEENVMLQLQLRQYETRWSEYEAKMKSMEESWQKQLTSLQMSLATAKKSLFADDMSSQPGRLDASPNHHNFDFEDTMSADTYTPQGTPNMQPRASDAILSRNSDGPKNAVSHLIEEFEHRTQIFEDGAGCLIDTKSGKSGPTMNSCEELRELKIRFASWKKDYKARLSETKAALQKTDNSKSNKARKKWWGTICTR